nr:MAG TPA: RimK-related lysine biosynthesis protein, Probable-dependent amine/thiol ligase family Amino-group [Caudoviricetes sp.]
MIICRDCYIPMQSIMSFSKDRHEKFCRCPKCKGETKHMRLDDKSLDFGEYLYREMKKR